MKRIVITTTLAAAFAGSAFAESPLAVHEEPFVSITTRALVQAELDEFKRAGVNPWSTSYNPLGQFRSAKTRSEVTAGYLAARDEVHALTGEDSGSDWLRTANRATPAGRMLASR